MLLHLYIASTRSCCCARPSAAQHNSSVSRCSAAFPPTKADYRPPVQDQGRSLSRRRVCVSPRYRASRIRGPSFGSVIDAPVLLYSAYTRDSVRRHDSSPHNAPHPRPERTRADRNSAVAARGRRRLTNSSVTSTHGGDPFRPFVLLIAAQSAQDICLYTDQQFAGGRTCASEVCNQRLVTATVIVITLEQAQPSTLSSRLSTSTAVDYRSGSHSNSIVGR